MSYDELHRKSCTHTSILCKRMRHFSNMEARNNSSYELVGCPIQSNHFERLNSSASRFRVAQFDECFSKNKNNSLSPSDILVQIFHFILAWLTYMENSRRMHKYNLEINVRNPQWQFSFCQFHQRKHWIRSMKCQLILARKSYSSQTIYLIINWKFKLNQDIKLTMNISVLNCWLDYELCQSYITNDVRIWMLIGEKSP